MHGIHVRRSMLNHKGLRSCFRSTYSSLLSFLRSAVLSLHVSVVSFFPALKQKSAKKTEGVKKKVPKNRPSVKKRPSSSHASTKSPS